MLQPLVPRTRWRENPPLSHAQIGQQRGWIPLRWALGLSAVCLFTLSAGGAAAQNGDGNGNVSYLVTIPSDPALEATASRLQSIVRVRLMQGPESQWTGPDQIFVAYSAAAAGQRAAALRHLEAGRNAYLNLQLQEAVSELKAALRAFEAAASVMETPDAIGEALLYLGASQVALGRPRESRDTFQQLHRQLPELEPDDQVFNPAVVNAYRDAKRGLATSGTLTVRSQEPASAYVDYRYRGITPATVDGLAAGSHIVRVTRAGARPAVDTVNLRRGRDAELELSPDQSERSEALNQLRATLALQDLPEALEDSPEAEELAGHLAVDVLALLKVSPGPDSETVAIELAAYDAEHGNRLLRIAGQAPTEPALLEDAARRVLDQALAVIAQHEPGEGSEPVDADPPSNIPAPESEPEDDGNIFEKWYFWVAVGAVAAGGGVATYLLLQDSGEDAPAGGQIVLRF